MVLAVRWGRHANGAVVAREEEWLGREVASHARWRAISLTRERLEETGGGAQWSATAVTWRRARTARRQSIVTA